MFHAGTVAGEVETALHTFGAGVTGKYKAKYRSLSFNLKDVNNPDLRRAVLAREITANVRLLPFSTTEPLNHYKDDTFEYTIPYYTLYLEIGS